MEFKITSIDELEDGSATLNIDMDNEMREFLINVAIIDILQTAIDSFNERLPNDTPKTLETSIKDYIFEGEMEESKKKRQKQKKV